MRLRVHPTVFVVLCALACAAWLTARPDEQVRVADRYMRAQAVSTLFSGAALVAHRGRVVFSGGFGYADVERRVRNETHTQYRIGSITKSLTAILVLKLQEGGTLGVSTPICNYLESCPAHWSGLSIHHLLSHTSGIADFTAVDDYLALTATQATRDEVIARFRDLPLKFEPGAQFEYSNSNYHLLGAIIENVTGTSYAQALSEHILEPLSLNDTFMDSANADRTHVAVGYRPATDDTLQPDSPLYPAWSFAAGGVFSTVEDLFRLSLALETDELLSQASKDAMWTPVKGAYGYGWNMPAPGPETLHRRVRMHAGRSQGYTACFVRFPGDDLTAIVLSNNVMGDTCTIVKDLAAIVLGEPYTIPIARRAIRVDHAILERYAGRYRYTEDFTLTLVREGDTLVVLWPRSPDRLQLFAESETEFFFKTFDIQAKFTTNGRNETTGFTVRGRGQSLFLERIRD
jgi:CubicO group peptidase (beta-lactamase class C family)